jgi:group I intron endonuclease
MNEATKTTPTRSGVYIIRNRKSRAVYVGSTSRSIDTRLKEHLRYLRAGRHENQHLQHAFDKYGEGAFDLLPLEYIEDFDDILRREQYWIDRYIRSKRIVCYNISPTAGMVRGMVHSKESVEKVTQKISKTWTGFISPDGQAFRNITNLEMFCREHRLDAPNMRAVHSGKERHHKGWVRLEDPQKPIRIAPGRIFAFISPTGELHDNIISLTKFCKERNLSISCMHNVFMGKSSNHKGWTSLGQQQGKNEYVFVSPQGEVYRFGTRRNYFNGSISLKQFCNQNDLWYSAMLKVHRGKQISHLGWTKYKSVSSSPLPENLTAPSNSDPNLP